MRDAPSLLMILLFAFLAGGALWLFYNSRGKS